MKTKGFLVAGFLAAATAFASTVSTPVSTLTPGKYVLHTPDNTIPAPFTDKTNRFDTIELCDAAAKSLNKVLKYKCDQSTGVAVTMTMTSTCADEKAPKVYLTQVTIGTDKFWEIPSDGFDLAPGSDTVYVEMAPLYVHNATWPAGYPACWVKGRTPRSEWRFNAKDEPGKAFMEHLEPGMVAEDQHPDGPPEAIVAGCCWNDHYQELWAARQETPADPDAP